MVGEDFDRVIQSGFRGTAFATATGLLVTIATGCSPGFSPLQSSLSAQSSVDLTAGEPPLSPSPPKSIVPELKSWEDSFPDPLRADDCLKNDKFNICLTWRDPVTTYGDAFAPVFTPSSATTDQEEKTFVFGAKIPTSGTLLNKHFQLATDGYTLVAPTANGDWKHRYTNDTNHNVAQIHAWYWVNRQRARAIERTGTFHFSYETIGKRGKIFAFDRNERNNAYFSSVDFSVHIGYGTLHESVGREDCALDGGFLAHEVGHGNFTAASPSSIYDNLSVSCGENDCCPNKNGCSSAIHEGIGDLHILFLYPKDGGNTLYWANSLKGDEQRSLDRAEEIGMTAQGQYTDHSGEIHAMGTVYASIWYGVWKKSKSRGSEKDIEILFSEHLSTLGPNDTFLTAFTPIKSLANQLFQASAETILADFRAEYGRVGLVVN